VTTWSSLMGSLPRSEDFKTRMSKEVQTGYECGIGLENFSDVKPADIFEVYEVEEVAAEL